METLDKRHSFFKSDFKTRATDDGKKYISGYFAVFNQETQLWDDVYEEISPTAFDNALKNDDVRCLFNHNDDIVLGRTKNQTLILRADNFGLWGEVEINQADTEALNAYERIKRGDITGCSFGFDVVSEKMTDRGQTFLYTVEDLKLFEVSPCTFPAYPQTEIQSRKKQYEQTQKRTVQQQKTELKKRLEAMK